MMSLSANWSLAVAYLLIGVAMGAGDVAALEMTSRSLPNGTARATIMRFTRSYLLRLAIAALVLLLAIRIRPEWAVIVVVGSLLGRVLNIANLLRRR